MNICKIFQEMSVKQHMPIGCNVKGPVFQSKKRRPSSSRDSDDNDVLIEISDDEDFTKGKSLIVVPITEISPNNTKKQ